MCPLDALSPDSSESIAPNHFSKFDREHGFLSGLRFWYLWDYKWTKSKSAQKAFSWSNFEKRFGAIDSGEPGEGASRGHIIRKNFRKLLLRSLIQSKYYPSKYGWTSARLADIRLIGS